MKKLILSTTMAVMTVLGLGGVAMLAPAYATGNTEVIAANTGLDNQKDYLKKSNGGNNTDVLSIVNIGINVVLGLIALAAVIMIIIGGLNYTTSQGESAKVKKAKDTILYGVIGLVIALLAFAIVNFVLMNVFSNQSI